MLSDLIIARPEDASSILNAGGHAAIWPTLEAKSVDQVKLASLAFILRGKALNDEAVVAYMKAFQALVDGRDDGPWIDLLPSELVLDLAILPNERIPSIAQAWTDTDEARLDRWHVSDVVELLKHLCSFCGSAVAEGKGVLLWLCL